MPAHQGVVWITEVSPDGNWLATAGGTDQTLRIWDTTTNCSQAMMRIGDAVDTFTWLSPATVALGGPAGLYRFDPLTDASRDRC